MLDHVIQDEAIRKSLKDRIARALSLNFKNAQEELKKILKDEAIQPITYNHYYTDNIQKARVDDTKKKLQKSVNDALRTDSYGMIEVKEKKKSPPSLNLENLTAALQTTVVVDMTKQACEESLAALDAYYKV